MHIVDLDAQHQICYVSACVPMYMWEYAWQSHTYFKGNYADVFFTRQMTGPNTSNSSSSLLLF